MESLNSPENFDKQKVSFSPELKPLIKDPAHIPVIKSRLPSKKLSNFQRKPDEPEETFSRTAVNFNVRTTTNDESGEYNSLNVNKLAFSDVFETSATKDVYQSPESKKKAFDFSLKTINFCAKSPTFSQENIKQQGSLDKNFKRKSVVVPKGPSQTPKGTPEILKISPKNMRKVGDLKIFHPGVIIKKEELIEKIQKKSSLENNNYDRLFCRAENGITDFGERKRNHAKSKLTEAFQKAEIYNDKVVRQINFEKENQEEEKNFQELFDVLNNLN